MRKIILAAILLGFSVSAHAEDKKNPLGQQKAPPWVRSLGMRSGSGHAVAGAAAGGAIAPSREQEGRRIEAAIAADCVGHVRAL